MDKPLESTSFDVVRRVRKLADLRKVGHAGTLDPKATGLLAVALGRCTKLIRYLDLDDKTYLFSLRLGEATETLDTEGEVVTTEGWEHVDRRDVEEALEAFTGRIEQVPPAYSAVKVDGRRAHRLARAGEEVDLDARTVEIHELELTDWKPPDAEFRVRCGGGTYVRSLVRDITQAVDTVGHATAIRRSELGEFSVRQAEELEELTDENIASHLLSPLQMVKNLARYRADDDEIEDIGHGRPLWAPGDWERGEYVAGHDGAGRLLAVFECTEVADGNCQLWPRRVMV